MTGTIRLFLADIPERLSYSGWRDRPFFLNSASVETRSFSFFGVEVGFDPQAVSEGNGVGINTGLEAFDLSD
jgi:hypothetical protein